MKTLRLRKFSKIPGKKNRTQVDLLWELHEFWALNLLFKIFRRALVSKEMGVGNVCDGQGQSKNGRDLA